MTKERIQQLLNSEGPHWVWRSPTECDESELEELCRLALANRMTQERILRWHADAGESPSGYIECRTDDVLKLLQEGSGR